jgi:hypothetical protein
MVGARALLLSAALVSCRRTEARKTDEERKLDRGPTKFVELEKGNHERGFFADGAFVVHVRGAFDRFDLATHRKSRLATKVPEPGVAGALLFGADARATLCVRGRWMEDSFEVLLLGSLEDEPRKLAEIPGTALEVRSDDADWFVLRRTAIGGWGEIVGISRPGGNRRSIAAAEGLSSFALDDRYVYWLEGTQQQTVLRKKKLGGPTETIAATAWAESIFVRGDFVHARGPHGVISRVPKSGGTFAETADVADTLADDEAGYCWCDARRVFCRGADDVSRELLLPSGAKCDWLSLSRSHVVAQSNAALWVADRP